MTADAIAHLLHARPAGRGRWQGLCPAHRDHSPSLSISEGREGRTLLRCWTGCSAEAVLKAAGLRMADLFAGPPLTPAEARRAAKACEQREDEARRRRNAHGAACDRLHKLERIGNELGAKLARLSDDASQGSTMTALFHTVMDRIRTAEAQELELRP